MKKILFIGLLLIATSVPLLSVYAQNPAPTTPTEVQLLEPSVLGGTGDQSAPTFSAYISNIFTQILIVAAVLAVLMIVIGGLQYILSFSGGSKEEGKKRMTQALIGLILALAAWLILNTINSSLTDINLSLEGVAAPVDTTPTSLVYRPLAGGGDTTNRADFSSRDQCLQYVRDRIARETAAGTPVTVSENDCRPSAETSGDVTTSGRDARQECLQQGYIECGYYPQKPGEEWDPVPRTACEGYTTPDSALSCFGKLSPDPDTSSYLMGVKNNTVCFDGPYESEEACGVVAQNSSSLRLDNDSATSCKSRATFLSQYSDKPLCENIADPGTGDAASTGGSWDDWNYDPGISRQKGDASPSLQALLTCIRGKIPDPAVGRISSISDSRYIGNLGVCNTTECGGNRCAHSCRSCHYGGGTSQGKSMAVDFGDEVNKGVIMRAASDCGVTSSRIIDEGDHVHVSTNDCPRN